MLSFLCWKVKVQLTVKKLPPPHQIIVLQYLVGFIHIFFMTFMCYCENSTHKLTNLKLTCLLIQIINFE